MYQHSKRVVQAHVRSAGPVVSARPQHAGPAPGSEAGVFDHSPPLLGLGTVGGRPLPGPVQAHMANAFGADFASVRIHEGPAAPSMGALAYAQGEEIQFAPGQFNPATPAGQRLLGHELTHVLQQRAGRVSAPQGKGLPINESPALEAEADALGDRVARGERVQVPGSAAAARGGLRQAGPAISLAPSAAPIQRGKVSFAPSVAENEGKSLPSHTVKPKALDPKSVAKVEFARFFEGLMGKLGFPVMLGGGGAAALLGSGRSIKDLDFKMSNQLKEIWKKSPEEVAKEIVTRLEQQGFEAVPTNLNDDTFKYVLRLSVKAPKSEEPMDVSVTSTGLYDEKKVGKGAVTVIASPDLILDKAFAFAERAITDPDKMYTDFIDLTAVLRKYPKEITPNALEIRWNGYRKKWRREPNVKDESVGEEILKRTELIHQRFGDQEGRILLAGRFVANLELAIATEALIERDVKRQSELASVKESKPKEAPKKTAVSSEPALDDSARKPFLAKLQEAFEGGKEQQILVTVTQQKIFQAATLKLSKAGTTMLLVSAFNDGLRNIYGAKLAACKDHLLATSPHKGTAGYDKLLNQAYSEWKSKLMKLGDGDQNGLAAMVTNAMAALAEVAV